MQQVPRSCRSSPGSLQRDGGVSCRCYTFAFSQPMGLHSLATIGVTMSDLERRHAFRFRGFQSHGIPDQGGCLSHSFHRWPCRVTPALIGLASGVGVFMTWSMRSSLASLSTLSLKWAVCFTSSSRLFQHCKLSFNVAHPSVMELSQ